MITAEERDIVLRYLKPLRPVRVGIFGSYARGESNKNSDLDILIQLEENHKTSLLTLAGIQQDLTDALGIPVDIVTEKYLSKYIRPFIERDLKYIL